MSKPGSPASSAWQHFQTHYREYPEIQLALDISRVEFPRDYFRAMAEPMRQAFKEIAALEAGAIANPDENRQVGHYWLRNPALAPAPHGSAIRKAIRQIQQFAACVHAGQLRGQRGRFFHVLIVGIGGSALGPQFVDKALSQPGEDKLVPHYFDNTDPDGMDRELSRLKGQLGNTLCVVISKSGGTKETANGVVELKAAYARAKLEFHRHAVAVTVPDSKLDQQAVQEGWLARFPIWDWVGGRTSETSAVGLLPAALQGFDIQALLAGAKACDAVTRRTEVRDNPAALLALSWHCIGNGKGEKDMVVIPYKDRLELFSRYLQQLVMESLGKEKDRDGKRVNQGLAVYGNKGSTDQHAYVQQLRDGLNNFFVVFVEVLKDRWGASPPVADRTTSGDYLNGFLLGTREALSERSRPTLTLTISEVSAYTVGVLIALFERAVALYASLIHINAYHQPGVEAGKKAAEAVLDLQRRILARLETADQSLPRLFTAAQLAADLGVPEQTETVFKLCQHLSHNPGRGLQRVASKQPGGAANAQFRREPGQEST